MLDINLKDYPLFKDIPQNHLEYLKSKAEIIEYNRDEFIFQEEDKAEYVYLLKEGRVAILIDIGGGKKVIVFTIWPKNTFAWSALVPPYKMTASAKCIDSSKVIRIPKQAFFEFMKKDPEAGIIIMQKIAEIISKRLKDTRLQLINLIQWNT